MRKIILLSLLVIFLLPVGAKATLFHDNWIVNNSNSFKCDLYSNQNMLVAVRYENISSVDSINSTKFHYYVSPYTYGRPIFSLGIFKTDASGKLTDLVWQATPSTWDFQGGGEYTAYPNIPLESSNYTFVIKISGCGGVVQNYLIIYGTSATNGYMNRTVPYGYDLTHMLNVSLSSNSTYQMQLQATGNNSIANPVEVGNSTTYPYYYWFGSNNCTSISTAGHGYLTCTANLTIPSDCVNITSDAYSTVVLYNETGMSGIGGYNLLWVARCKEFAWDQPSTCTEGGIWIYSGLTYINTTSQFSRWSCNPKSQIDQSCSKFYGVCSYENLNTPMHSYYSHYLSNQTAEAWFSLVMPEGCILGADARFKLIGRMTASCYIQNQTQSGIYIDGEKSQCNHEIKCFNSNAIVEIFPDCTNYFTYCPYGCGDGACSITTTGVASSIPTTETGDAIKQGTDFFSTPIVYWTLIILGISFLTEIGLAKYGVKTNGKVFIIVFIICANLLAIVPLVKVQGVMNTVYPRWLLILEVVIVGGFVAINMRKSSTG